MNDNELVERLYKLTPSPMQEQFAKQSHMFQDMAQRIAKIKGIPEGVFWSEEELKQHFDDVSSLLPVPSEIGGGLLPKLEHKPDPIRSNYMPLENTHNHMWCHDEGTCRGEFCTVHNRSDHIMRGFPQHWRGDRGIMERTCPHGIGHPDPDEINEDKTHGCDGCCFGGFPLQESNENVIDVEK